MKLKFSKFEPVLGICNSKGEVFIWDCEREMLNDWSSKYSLGLNMDYDFKGIMFPTSEKVLMYTSNSLVSICMHSNTVKILGDYKGVLGVELGAGGLVVCEQGWRDISVLERKRYGS